MTVVEVVREEEGGDKGKGFESSTLRHILRDRIASALADFKRLPFPKVRIFIVYLGESVMGHVASFPPISFMPVLLCVVHDLDIQF